MVSLVGHQEKQVLRSANRSKCEEHDEGHFYFVARILSVVSGILGATQQLVRDCAGLRTYI